MVPSPMTRVSSNKNSTSDTPPVNQLSNYEGEEQVASDDYSPVLRRRNMRRTVSMANYEEITGEEKRERLKQPDKPIHRHLDSLFSTSSGFTNYRGLLNLCILLLAISNTRLVLENLIKYGILIDPVASFQMFLLNPSNWPNVALLALLELFILFAFKTECLLAKNCISDKSGQLLYCVNLLVLLIFPAALILHLHPNPAFSIVTLGFYTIVFLKLVSYCSVNSWCRTQVMRETPLKRHKSFSSSEGRKIPQSGKVGSQLVTYPNNLNLKDLHYFMFAPTLCYELNFPRSSRIRKSFLLKRFIEMIFLWQVMLALLQQWLEPIVRNSMKPLAEMDIKRSFERLLKLAIPNHMIWLIFFYWFFHSCLNVVAELLQFGDREFYHDWWNSETVSYFWKSWNIPVHRWASRHLYKPLVKRGHSKFTASCLVFLLSAFFHEYLVSVPLKMFRWWAFMGMCLQVPLAVIVDSRNYGKYGNMAVWLSLILGQPIAILAYMHDYYILSKTE
ncbi:diacylglycerol O-acyltransferase 1 [Octopus bimaculoides]|uniref:O-acyltransferase n=1 Tax=Octopus bimaculoides TaxID=37653 RepID=A0A0L8HQN7_OCTBM|nr:diacylglycerol O-acyltransferase 1 [Octopus bimaculoides]|eukprot:XP_014770315.1 PREDICTED: diacylglycerol O-acyltransferase 1-like [Octopus bimaculoides]